MTCLVNYPSLDRLLKTEVQIGSVTFLTIFCDRDHRGLHQKAADIELIDK